MAPCLSARSVPPTLHPPHSQPPSPPLLSTSPAQGPYFSLDYKLSQLQYSQTAAGVPPAWRRADSVGGLPTFWQLERPDLPATVGHPAPMAALATPWGRLFVGGALRAGSVSLAGAQLNLGPQPASWALWRDAAQPSLSLSLAGAPGINLWGQLALPFNSLPALRQLDLLAKPQTSQWWLSTSQRQAVPARNLAAVVRPIGLVLERLFVGLYQPAAQGNALLALDVTGSAQGASLRLHFRAGYWALAPEAAAAMGASAIAQEFALVLHVSSWWEGVCAGSMPGRLWRMAQQCPAPLPACRAQCSERATHPPTLPHPKSCRRPTRTQTLSPRSPWRLAAAPSPCPQRCSSPAAAPTCSHGRK